MYAHQQQRKKSNTFAVDLQRMMHSQQVCGRALNHLSMLLPLAAHTSEHVLEGAAWSALLHKQSQDENEHVELDEAALLEQLGELEVRSRGEVWCVFVWAGELLTDGGPSCSLRDPSPTTHARRK